MTDDARPPDAPGTDVLLDELARDVRRVAARLRSMPAARLEPKAEAVRTVLQHLADTTATLEAPTGTTPPTRPVPALPPAALGDQLEVLGNDLLTATRATPAQSARPSSPHPVATAAEALATLRRTL